MLAHELLEEEEEEEEEEVGGLKNVGEGDRSRNGGRRAQCSGNPAPRMPVFPAV